MRFPELLDARDVLVLFRSCLFVRKLRLQLFISLCAANAKALAGKIIDDAPTSAQNRRFVIDMVALAN